MNPNCIQAITSYAEKAFNRKLSSAELKGMDDDLNYHRKKLAAEMLDQGQPASGAVFEMELANLCRCLSRKKQKSD